MAHARKAFDRITSDAYLAGENDGLWRHELGNGRVFAMAGAIERHNVVKLNIAGRFNASLDEPCRIFDGDTKLRIERNEDIRFYYPEIFVPCATGNPDEYVRGDAVLVIEVLSPTTERTDRDEKFAAYTSLPMLSEHVLVEQGYPSVEMYRRRTGWQLEQYGPGAAVTFESIGQTPTLDQIYRPIRF